MPPNTTQGSAPVRIDLAGGTLDIWPLYLLHPGSVTVNAAIGHRAIARVTDRSNGVRIQSIDRGVKETADDADDDGRRPARYG